MNILKKIDIHAHAMLGEGLTWPNGNPLVSAEGLIEVYDRLGVERGILLPLISPECFYELSTNRECMEIVKRYPDRFNWFCSIDPRMGLNSTETDFMRILRYYQSLGAKGVGEITANLYFDDPRVCQLFAACQACGMPVLFHIGDMGGDYGLVDELGLPRLEKCLESFPNLMFIGHSQKFWAEISGDLTAGIRAGYPTGPVAPGGRVTELLRRYPNLYCDLSANSGANAMMRDPEHAAAFLEEFSDRVFYGMDLCCPQNAQLQLGKLPAFLDELMLSGRISYDTYSKISQGNAKVLLHL